MTPILVGIGLLFLLVVGGWILFVDTRPRGTVKGAVTLDYRIVLAGQVEFYAANGWRSAPANIAFDGTYIADNIPFGEYTVLVSVPIDKMTQHLEQVESFKKIFESQSGKMPEFVPVEEELPPEFGDATQSPLKVKIDSPTQTFNIQMLKGARS